MRWENVTQFGWASDCGPGLAALAQPMSARLSSWIGKTHHRKRCLGTLTHIGFETIDQTAHVA